MARVVEVSSTLSPPSEEVLDPVGRDGSGAGVCRCGPGEVDPASLVGGGGQAGGGAGAEEGGGDAQLDRLPGSPGGEGAVPEPADARIGVLVLNRGAEGELVAAEVQGEVGGGGSEVGSELYPERAPLRLDANVRDRVGGAGVAEFAVAEEVAAEGGAGVVAAADPEGNPLGGEGGGPDRGPPGGGAGGAGGAGDACGGDGGDAVVPGVVGGQAAVAVGGGGGAAVGDEPGPAGTPVGGDLDPVAADEGGPGAGRGLPGELDAGGLARGGGGRQAGRGGPARDQPDGDGVAGGPAQAGAAEDEPLVPGISVAGAEVERSRVQAQGEIAWRRDGACREAEGQAALGKHDALHGMLGAADREFRRGQRAEAAGEVPEAAIAGADGERGGPQDGLAGSGGGGLGGGARADGVDGRDAVAARGAEGQAGVAVGGAGGARVGDEVGPAGTPVGGHLDPVAADGGAAVVSRGGPGEVDQGGSAGGGGQAGGGAGGGQARDELHGDGVADGPARAGAAPEKLLAVDIARAGAEVERGRVQVQGEAAWKRERAVREAEGHAAGPVLREPLHGMAGPADRELRRGQMAVAAGAVPGMGPLAADREGGGPYDEGVGRGGGGIGGGAGAGGVDGRYAVVARGADGQAGVPIGSAGGAGVGDEVGPAGTPVGGNLDPVAGDGGAAVICRGGPGEVDPVAARGGGEAAGGAGGTDPGQLDRDGLADGPVQSGVVPGKPPVAGIAVALAEVEGSRAQAQGEAAWRREPAGRDVEVQSVLPVLGVAIEPLHGVGGPVDRELRRGKRARDACVVPEHGPGRDRALAAADGQGRGPDDPLAGSGGGGIGGGADAGGVDGDDAVVAGVAEREAAVGVGRGGRPGVVDEHGPGVAAVGGDLDPVAGDGGAAVVLRGRPGEVDPVVARGGGEAAGGAGGSGRGVRRDQLDGDGLALRPAQAVNGPREAAVAFGQACRAEAERGRVQVQHELAWRRELAAVTQREDQIVESLRGAAIERLHDVGGPVDRELRRGQRACSACLVPEHGPANDRALAALAAADGQGRAPDDPLAGSGGGGLGGGAGAAGVDGGDAVVAGVAEREAAVGVGRGGRPGIGDEHGPGAAAVGGDLDPVAPDAVGAAVLRGGPGEVDARPRRDGGEAGGRGRDGVDAQLDRLADGPVREGSLPGEAPEPFSEIAEGEGRAVNVEGEVAGVGSEVVFESEVEQLLAARGNGKLLEPVGCAAVGEFVVGEAAGIVARALHLAAAEEESAELLDCEGGGPDLSLAGSGGGGEAEAGEREQGGKRAEPAGTLAIG